MFTKIQYTWSIHTYMKNYIEDATHVCIHALDQQSATAQAAIMLSRKYFSVKIIDYIIQSYEVIVLIYLPQVNIFIRCYLLYTSNVKRCYHQTNTLKNFTWSGSIYA